MSRENHFVNALAYESEKIDGKKKFPVVRNLGRSLEVTGWDNDVDFFQFFESAKVKNPSRKESQSPSFEMRVMVKKAIHVKNSPLLYKISTISLEDSRQSPNNRSNLVDHYKLLKTKKKFSSVYFPQKRRAHYKSDIKRNSVPEISNLLHLLRPETKNPVKALIVPQLKSRTELYRSYSKSKSKKKLDFLFLNSLSPDPKCQLKLFK
jgi:hypothetical protein